MNSGAFGRSQNWTVYGIGISFPHNFLTFLVFQMIWIITFVGVLVLSVDLGIYIGLVCSLLLLIYKSERPKTYLLGPVDDLDIYVPINKFNKVRELDGFKIFQMCGPLNFSNVEYFTNELENKCDISVKSVLIFDSLVLK